METESVQPTQWRNNILIILAVLAAILLALILAQLDNMNELIQPLPTTVAQILPPANPTLVQSTATSAPSLTPIATNTPVEAEATTLATATATPAAVLPPGCGQIPVGWLPYTVQPGDTLHSLSIRTGATVEAIAYANCITMEPLLVGSTIYLPATPPVLPPCGPPPYWIVYTVQYGDTLYSLATRTGTTVYTVMQANCLNNTYIYAGQPLYLPTYPVMPPTATAMPTMIPTNTPPMTSTVTATPTGTILPTMTATATATGTILPTMTSTPTSTANPTLLPTMTMTPSPTGTANPTALPTMTATGAPTSIPTLPPPPTAYP